MIVVDSHVHYGSDHPAGQLVAEANAAGVDQIVQVSEKATGWDNSLSIQGALDHPQGVTGVIGRFDPTAPNIEQRLIEYKAQPAILGIRITWHSQPPGANWLRDRELDPFFSACEKHDVAVQMNTPYQSVEMKETARRFPGLRILIDHMFVRFYENKDNKDIFSEWPVLLELAEESNVWVKVSYFPEACSVFETFPYPKGQQYFKELYEHVGPKKLLWGSNFPPVAKVCTYKQALEFARDHCTFLSASDKEAILGGNYLERFGPKRVALR